MRDGASPSKQDPGVAMKKYPVVDSLSKTWSPVLADESKRKTIGRGKQCMSDRN